MSKQQRTVYVSDFNETNLSPDKTESQFNFYQLEKEHTKAFSLIKKFDYVIDLERMKRILDNQMKLAAIFTKQLSLKEFRGLTHDSNILVEANLWKTPVILHGMLFLIKNGYFGSARVLARQCFETLIYAKYSWLDKSMATKYSNKKVGYDQSNNLTINYVFKSLGQKKGSLQTKYSKLCDFDHPTIYSQQLPLSLESVEEKRYFIDLISYTTDLLFTLMLMNLHFLNLVNRQTRGVCFGYYDDVPGKSARIKKLKTDIKNEIKAHYKVRVKFQTPKEEIKEIKMTARSFSRKWA